MKKWLLLIPVLILVLSAIVLVVVFKQLGQDKTPETSFEVRFRKGVSYSPRSSLAIGDFWEKAAQAGEVVRGGDDWQKLGDERTSSKNVVEMAPGSNLVPVIEVNFFNQDTGQLLLPLNSVNKTAYKDAAVEFAGKYHPPYFGMGVEVDTFYRVSPAQFDDFVALFSEVYDAVKAVSPETRIFTTFQYEKLQGLRGGIFGGVNDASKNNWSLLGKFPKADLFAFTSYPGLIYKDPSNIPVDYYSRVASFTSKPVAFTEIGWFSGTVIKGWESSEGEQARFITRFFELTTNLNLQLAIWLHMYPQTAEEPFATMSLFSPDGAPKAAWNTWVSAGR